MERVKTVVLLHQRGTGRPGAADRQIERHRSSSPVGLVDVLVGGINPEAGSQPGAEPEDPDDPSSRMRPSLTATVSQLAGLALSLWP